MTTEAGFLSSIAILGLYDYSNFHRHADACFQRTGCHIPSDSDDKPASLGMLLLGLGSIVFMPIFKTATHLPPYVGMMLSLAS